MKKEMERRKWLRQIPDRLEDFWIFAGVCFVGILLALVFVNGDNAGRLATNRYLMLFVLVFFLMAGGLYIFSVHHKKTLWGRPLSHPVLWLFVGYLALYAVQLFWVNKVYFYTGWDVGMMRQRAEWILGGGSMAEMSIDAGYSVCPNNLVLFYAVCLMEKLGRFLSLEDPYLLCIDLSCLAVNLSCFLGLLILRKFTDSYVVHGCYLLVSTAAILFSPWIIIPYSDTYGMFFVMLGMWGLVCVDRKNLRWMVAAFAAVIGYRIKPSCVFPLFAVFLVYGVRFLFSLRERLKELCVLVFCTGVFWGLGLLMPLWVQHAYSFRLMPELELSHTHYLMMGFSAESGGSFSSEDYLLSTQIPDLETRERVNKEEFVRRVTALWEDKTLGEFLRGKALINFDDGTFGWTQEGNFFEVQIRHENILWDWFLSTYVPAGVWENDGKYYPLYRTITQILWLFMLTGVLFVGIGRKKSRTLKACMMVAVCGLFVFVMLFEARARYLYLYTPLILILSLLGYEGIWRRAADSFPNDLVHAFRRPLPLPEWYCWTNRYRIGICILKNRVWSIIINMLCSEKGRNGELL